MVKRKFSARLNRQVWGFDITLSNSKRIRQYIYDDKRSAEEAMLALKIRDRERQLGISTGPPPNRPLLTELVEKKVATIARGNERVRSTRVLQQLVDLLPVGIYVDEVTTPHIRLFVERRQRDEQAPTSINRELNIIAATLNGASMFYPQLSQWVPPRMPRPKAPSRGRERLITDEELSALLAWLLKPKEGFESLNFYQARLRVGHILHWASLTGMRHSEINQLRWTDIDQTGNQVRVVGTKTDSIRYLVISPTMQMILDARRPITGNGPFIFNQGGNTGSKFYKIMKVACEACGIVYGRFEEGGLTLHDTRHTVTTRLIQGGVDLATIGSITGHKDRSLILYYSHATANSRKNAADVIERQAGAEAVRIDKKKAG
jgi:integrase